jgi:hypothetical protein
MAISGSCVSMIEKHCSGITPSAESATLLRTRNTRKRHSGRLASLASHRSGQNGLDTRHGQHHRGTWAEQSRMSSLPLELFGSAMGRSPGTDAGAIPRADRSVPPLRWSNAASHSRFICGWICPTSAIPLVGWHSISGTAKSPFVCYSPRHP